MKLISKKNYNIFFHYQWSWILVPLLLLLWYMVPNIRNIIAISMICVIIIGCYETYILNLSNILKCISFIGYIILIIPLILPFIKKKFNIYIKDKNNNLKSSNLKSSNLKSSKLKSTKFKQKNNVKFSNKNVYYYDNSFKYLFSFNYYNFIVFIISNIFIIYSPIWPYKLKKKKFIWIYNITTLFLWTYYSFIK